MTVYVLLQKHPDPNAILFRKKLIDHEIKVGRSTIPALTKFQAVSREHALFCKTSDGDVIIKDLNSSNGVYINGVRIKRDLFHKINTGDIIGLGVPSLDGQTGFVCILTEEHILSQVKEEIIEIIDSDDECPASDLAPKSNPVPQAPIESKSSISGFVLQEPIDKPVLITSNDHMHIEDAKKVSENVKSQAACSLNGNNITSNDHMHIEDAKKVQKNVKSQAACSLNRNYITSNDHMNIEDAKKVSKNTKSQAACSLNENNITSNDHMHIEDAKKVTKNIKSQAACSLNGNNITVEHHSSNAAQTSTIAQGKPSFKTINVKKCYVSLTRCDSEHFDWAPGVPNPFRKRKNEKTNGRTNSLSYKRRRKHVKPLISDSSDESDDESARLSHNADKNETVNRKNLSVENRNGEYLGSEKKRKTLDSSSSSNHGLCESNIEDYSRTVFSSEQQAMNQDSHQPEKEMDSTCYSQHEEIIILSDEESYFDFSSSQSCHPIKEEPPDVQEDIDNYNDNNIREVFEEPASASFIVEEEQDSSAENIESIAAFIDSSTKEVEENVPTALTLNLDCISESENSDCSDSAILCSAKLSLGCDFTENLSDKNEPPREVKDKVHTSSSMSVEKDKSVIKSVGRTLLTEPKPLQLRPRKMRGREEGFSEQKKYQVTRSSPRKNSEKSKKSIQLSPKKARKKASSSSHSDVTQQIRNSKSALKNFKIPRKSSAQSAEKQLKQSSENELNTFSSNSISFNKHSNSTNKKAAPVKTRPEKFGSRMAFLIDEVEIKPRKEKKSLEKANSAINGGMNSYKQRNNPNLISINTSPLKNRHGKVNDSSLEDRVQGSVDHNKVNDRFQKDTSKGAILHNRMNAQSLKNSSRSTVQHNRVGNHFLKDSSKDTVQHNRVDHSLKDSSRGTVHHNIVDNLSLKDGSRDTVLYNRVNDQSHNNLVSQGTSGINRLNDKSVRNNSQGTFEYYNANNKPLRDSSQGVSQYKVNNQSLKSCLKDSSDHNKANDQSPKVSLHVSFQHNRVSHQYIKDSSQNAPIHSRVNNQYPILSLASSEQLAVENRSFQRLDKPSTSNAHTAILTNPRDPRRRSSVSARELTTTKTSQVLSRPIKQKSIELPSPKHRPNFYSRANSSGLNYLIFVKKLINMKSVWLQEQDKVKDPPPEVKKGASDLPLHFKSYDAYVSFYVPMIMLEIWDYMYQESKEIFKSNKAVNKFYFSLLSYTSKNDCIELKCESIVAEKVSYKPKEGTIAILELTEAKSKIRQPFFGYIYKHNVVNNLNMSSLKVSAWKNLTSEWLDNASHWTFFVYVKKKEISFDLEGLMKGNGICYIRSKLRLFDALGQFKNSPLRNAILNPQWRTFNVEYAASEPTREYTASQMSVIKGITGELVNSKTEPKIILLQGPPGTGKTHTIIGLLEKLLLEDMKFTKVLVVAPSNAAVDEIGCRLIDLNEQSGWRGRTIKIVRIGSEKQIHEKILPYFLDKKAEKAFNRHTDVEKQRRDREIDKLKGDISRFDKKIANYATNEDLKYMKDHLEILEKQKCIKGQGQGGFRKMDYHTEMSTKELLLKECHIVLSTLNSCGLSILTRTFKPNSNVQFSCCIVDEATQCTEIEVLQPLTFGIDKLILVGDHKQLPATVTSKLACKHGFERSMFERFHIYLKKNFSNKKLICVLKEQFRMHTQICAFPSKQFYHNELITDPDVDVRYNLYPINPYMLLNILEGQEVNNSSSKLNCTEASVIVNICKCLLNVIDSPSSIGIITPYQGQRDLYKNALNQNPSYKDIEINTVDGFQGREKEIIIMSCVRANSQSGGIGFLASKHRLNVAITRAKKSLIICCHINSLMNDPEWRSLINNAYDRKLVIGVTSAKDIPYLFENCIKKKML